MNVLIRMAIKPPKIHHFYPRNAMQFKSISASFDFNLFSFFFFSSELGMACVVRSAEDQRWYRALFMQQTDKDMCEVAYFDYGNMETVNVSEIREIDEKLRFPCITVSCYIDGSVHCILSRCSLSYINIFSFDRCHVDEAKTVEAFGRSIESVVAIVRKGDIRCYPVFGRGENCHR